MNIIDLFIEFCCFSEDKNEILIKFLNLDNKKYIKKNINNLIRPKLLQLKKNNFSNIKKDKNNKFKNFSDLIYEISDNSLEKYNYIGNELEFLKCKNTNLNLEKLCVLYKYYPNEAISNVDLIYKNFKNNKYIFDKIKGFEESNIEIGIIIDKNKLNKLNSKIDLLTIENKSLEMKNRDSLKEINKILKFNLKLEKEKKILKDENKTLENYNLKLQDKIKTLEEKIKYYEEYYKDSIIIDKSFGQSENFKFCMIHTLKIKVLQKIHSDIKFVEYKDINNNEIEKFILNLKNSNIENIFIQSNNIKQSILNDIIFKSKKQNLKCFRIFFNNEKELNEKLCELK